MKGVILAGGLGTRLKPITNSINKHLLLIYDKPLIFYPLTTLILAGIRDFLLVIDKKDFENFRNLLGSGSNLGIRITYAFQDFALGIPDGIKIAREFIGSDSFALMLGDNIFYGVGLGRAIKKNIEQIESGSASAIAFTFQVSDPERFGTAVLSSSGEVVDLVEKPSSPTTNLAITGLYLLDNSAISKVDKLKPSNRGELEIIDLLKLYLSEKTLELVNLPLGTSWLDSGTFEAIYNSSSFIRASQTMQNLQIGDPTQAARINGWIPNEVSI